MSCNRQGKNNFSISYEINEKINFADSLSDGLIDRKIKIGMSLEEINNLFNNDLEYFPNWSSYSCRVYRYKYSFSPYFENNMGYIDFYIDKDRGLVSYYMTIWQNNHDKLFDKFLECVSLLNVKYGESSKDDWFVFYWTSKENDFPFGVIEITARIREDGDSPRISISYSGKNDTR
jgi:hypothetical protein